jgi:hypothetical protein
MHGLSLIFIGKHSASILGWVGSISYLLAYLLLTLKKVKPDQKLYHLMNIVGAAGLTLNAVYILDYPNVIVNLVWGIIALLAIWSIARRKQN